MDGLEGLHLLFSRVMAPIHAAFDSHPTNIIQLSEVIVEYIKAVFLGMRIRAFQKYVPIFVYEILCSIHTLQAFQCLDSI